MTCPVCHVADWEPPIDVAGLTVCPNCGSSIVIATGERATQWDIAGLDDSQVDQLRKARGRKRRTA